MLPEKKIDLELVLGNFMIGNEQGYWTSHKNACSFYGVSKNTLRSWADNDKIIYKRTPSNQRLYWISSKCNQPEKNSDLGSKQSIVYCRVSSCKQKDDLERQCLYLSSKYPNCRIIKDIGSGLNYKRQGLYKILELSNQGIIDKVVVSSKDRLARFGFELEWVLLQNDTKILVLDKTTKSREQEFTEDILAILQVFACRWNGKRRYKTTIKNEKDSNEIDLHTKENITKME